VLQLLSIILQMHYRLLWCKAPLSPFFFYLQKIKQNVINKYIYFLVLSFYDILSKFYILGFIFIYIL
jgi:hypothetical protein